MTNFLIDDGKNKIEGLDKNAIESALNNKASKQELNSAVQTINSELETKASKTELNSAVQTQTINSELETKASKQELNSEIARVDQRIDDLPEAMVFKGTLGTGGTIQELPTASASNEGFTYKVITAGTYAEQSARVGDIFVSNGSEWVLIPAGDDFNDTWRAIKVNGTEVLNNAISSGAVNFNEGDQLTITYDADTKTLNFNVVNTYTKNEVDDLIYDILPTEETGKVAIANFTTPLNKAIDLKAYFEAQQEAGTPTPTTPKAISGINAFNIFSDNKNLLEIADFEETRYFGVTFSCSNGVITANGQATQDLIFLIKPKRNYVKVNEIFDVKANTNYILSGCLGGAYNSTYWIQLLISGSGSEPHSSIGDSTTFSFTQEQINTQDRQLAIRVKNGTTLNNIKFYPMIRYANIISSDFEQYNGNKEIINLGGTYYGCQLEIDKNGHKKLVLNQFGFNGNDLIVVVKTGTTDNLSTFQINLANNHFSKAIAQTAKSSHFSLSNPSNTSGRMAQNSTDIFCVIDNTLLETDTAIGFISWLIENNVIFFYTLFEPIEIDFPDGEPINTLIGTNNIFVDYGDVEVKYKTNIESYVNARVNSTRGATLGILNNTKNEPEEIPEEKTEEIPEEPKEELKK